MTVLQETFLSENGIAVPKIGLGTWLIDNGEVEKAVCQAVNDGYRHIDTAQAYGNEEGVGKGIRSCGVNRENLFVTTKLAAEIKDYASAVKAIDRSLLTAKLDYFDLMLIHSPQPWDSFRKGNYDEGNREAWRALEDACKAGKLRAVGVSNFQKEDIENILRTCTIKPMVNQLLVHIGNTPFDLMNYCSKQNILVESYSPVAHGALLKNEAVQSMAASYGVSVAQLCLRYAVQLNTVVLPKAKNPAHIKENTQIDFVIREEDMEELKSIVMKDYGEYAGFPVFSGK